MAPRRKRTLDIEMAFEEFEKEMDQIEAEEETSVIIAEPSTDTKEDIKSGYKKDLTIYLSEEDKRMLRKYNNYVVNKLGLFPNRSVVIR